MLATGIRPSKFVTLEDLGVELLCPMTGPDHDAEACYNVDLEQSYQVTMNLISQRLDDRSILTGW